jgi:hypothetical protein
MDKPKAVTAAAHKLARLIYPVLTKGQEHYEERYRERCCGPVARRRRSRLLDRTAYRDNVNAGIGCLFLNRSRHRFSGASGSETAVRVPPKTLTPLIRASGANDTITRLKNRSMYSVVVLFSFN